MNYTKEEHNEFRFKANYINAVLLRKEDIDSMSDKEVAEFYFDNISKMPKYNSETNKDEGVEKIFNISKDIAEKSEMEYSPVILSTSDKGWHFDFDFLVMLKNTLEGTLENDITIEDLDNIMIAVNALAEQIALLKKA